MKPSQVEQALRIAINAGRPAMVWGPPGVGKSDVVAGTAAAIGREVRDMRLSLCDPTDLKGFPSPDKKTGTTHWLPSDELPTAKDKPGILFLDEVNAAPQAVQAAAYQLMLNRRIGNYELPEGWDIVAAGNRDSDRGATHRMPAPLSNRLIHLDFEVNLDDWSKWAIGHGIKTEVLGFLRFRPNLLHAFDPNQRAFPTPRSWQFVSELLTQGMPGDIQYEMLKGTVGEGAAAELEGFLRTYQNMPNPDAILLAPDSVEVPEEPATLYALSTVLGARASAQNIGNLMKFVDRMPVEFNIVTIRDAFRHNAAIASTRPFLDWSVKHSDVLI